MSAYDILGDDFDGDDIDGDDIDGLTGEDLVITAGDDILGDDILGASDLVGLSRKQKIALGIGAGAGAAGLGYLAYRKLKARKAARQRAIGQAVLNKRVGNSPMLGVRKPTRGREQPLPFYLANVPPAISTNVTTRPQTLFRGGRVVVPELSFQGGIFAPNPFAIQDIIVGRNSQFVARQQMPAAAFFQNSFGVRVQGDTSQISQDVTFIVLNRAAVNTDFEAVIIGESVE